MSTIDEKTQSYKRTVSTSKTVVSDKIKSLYKGSALCEMLPSGSSAIYVLFKTLATLNTDACTFLIANELYSGSVKIIENIASENKHIKLFFFNPTETNHLKLLIDILGSSLRCIYFESVSNPNGKMIDWTILKSLPPTTLVAVDNTFLSPFLFNPFELGASVVIDSCSKFLSNTKCISGTINFKSGLSKFTHAFLQYVRLFGLHISDEYCDTIYREIDTCKDRLYTAFKRTTQFLPQLQKIPKVVIVNHPKTDLLSEVYNKYFPLGCYPIISVAISPINKTVGLKAIKETLSKLCETENIPYITSFGHALDTIDCYPYFDSYKETDTLRLRIAVGYKGIDGFIDKFAKIISNL
jgi:cystathionine beta-lyase/cystathionine gamma-synthase